MRKRGGPHESDFEAKAHWDIGEDLYILYFERAGKVADKKYKINYFAILLPERDDWAKRIITNSIYKL